MYCFYIYRCILATDMARHNEILSDFKNIIPVFDVNSQDHRNQVSFLLYLFIIILFIIVAN